MLHSQPHEWYVDDGHKSTGPFTLDQIRGFLERGTIQANWHVTPAHDDPHPRLMTVFDLVKSQTDPAYSLLETLENARQRQLAYIHNHPSPLSSEHDPEINPFHHSGIGLRGRLTLIGALIATALGILYLWIGQDQRASSRETSSPRARTTKNPAYIRPQPRAEPPPPEPNELARQHQETAPWLNGAGRKRANSQPNFQSKTNSYSSQEMEREDQREDYEDYRQSADSAEPYRSDDSARYNRGFRGEIAPDDNNSLDPFDMPNSAGSDPYSNGDSDTRDTYPDSRREPSSLSEYPPQDQDLYDPYSPPRDDRNLGRNRGSATSQDRHSPLTD